MDINRYSPSYGVRHKHLIKLADCTTEEIFEFLYAIKSMKAKFTAHESTLILRGVTVALLFCDTSLRTRCALEIGIRQLGGVCVNLPYSLKDMQSGENIKDIVNVISRFGVGALVTRGISTANLEEYCAVSSIPIINSTNEDYIPLQTLCDLFTIWEKTGKLEGIKLGYVGKGTDSNLNSLVMGAVKCGLDVAVAAPPEYGMKREHLLNAEQYGNVYVTDNPVEAVRDADVVYTDNYEYHSPVPDKEREILKPYQVNNALMSFAKHNALFMHSLPASRGIEVTEDIIDGKSSVVLDQGENKLHTVKAVLTLLVD